MSAEAEPLVLSGLDEASLYHNPGEHGFFTLLWGNPETVARLAELKARQRELLLSPMPDTGRDQSGVTLKLPRPRPKIQQSYRLSDMPRVIEGLDQDRDTWISQAEFFRPNRRVVYLLRLNLCFVDLDTYKTPWKAYPPEMLATIVRGYCQDEDIPEPSLILYSGRGLQLKWLFHRPLPRAALPRWNAVQRELVTALHRFGADPGARDASRLLRLVDTINTRSGERVRVLWVNEAEGKVSHYSFEELAERILPVDRDTLRQERKIREARSEKGLRLLKGGKTGNLRTFSGRQLAWDRLEDLRTLSKLRGWPETGIPHGYRSKYLHWCLNFLLLSGAVHSRQLFHEAQALAREVCPDFTKDIRSVLSTLYRKAQAYEAGEKVEFEGRKYPPLYTPRNSTLIRLFNVTDEEMRQLGTIVTEEEAAERHRKRNRKAMDRVTYQRTAEQRRAEARLRRAKGLSIRDIAVEMGVSKSQVHRYLE